MRVHTVNKARKAGMICGKCEKEIEVGTMYYWFQFLHSPRSIRCASCYPKPSELTRSDFYSRLYEMQESRFSTNEDTTPEDLESERDEVVEQLNEMADECEEKRSNMPDGLQDSATGELLQERADALREAADELEGVDCSFDFEDDEDQEPDMGEGDDPLAEPDKEAETMKEQARTDRENEARKERVDEIADELQSILSGISCS